MQTLPDKDPHMSTRTPSVNKLPLKTDQIYEKELKAAEKEGRPIEEWAQMDHMFGIRRVR